MSNKASDPSAWPIRRQSGRAEELFVTPEGPFERRVEVLEVDGPTVVLGSAQRLPLFDRDRATKRGVELVVRRSGGSAVWLNPSDTVWVNVLIPAGDRLWIDDSTQSFFWLGDCWRAALIRAGIDSRDAVVHRAGLRKRRWSDVVCFAGLGPGEVVVDGRKVVGLSQRRTRDYALFQCAVLRRWDPAPLVSLLLPEVLAPDSEADVVADLAPLAGGVGDLDVLGPFLDELRAR